MGRRWGRQAFLLAAIVIGVGSLGGWRWREVPADEEAIARIEDALKDGRNAVAFRDLSLLLDRSPGWDQAAYLMGVCEKARGRLQEADAAWARIAPDSPFSSQAATGRLELFIERGRPADAEEWIEREARARGPEGTAMRVLLIPTLVQQGRVDEARRYLEQRWQVFDAEGHGTSEQAIYLARYHMELSWESPPADQVRDDLDRMGRRAPDDDRIWLARANLAIRTGALDEASQWIDRCLQRRPDDPVVWRARLAWAMTTGRLAEVRTALRHLPADPSAPAEIPRLSAWIASACGDVEAERRALTELVAAAPEDLDALDRLLKSERGDREKVAALERRKAQVEADRARYRVLFRRNQPSRDAAEVARLAERLGRPFEATVFRNVAIAEGLDLDDPEGIPRHPGESGRRREPIGRTLFDAVPTDCRRDRPSS
jgi:thioredoxin-like negative regulator of GroEL